MARKPAMARNETMAQKTELETLHSVVHCYLATLKNIARTMGSACPPVGGPYESRMDRLRTRLSFNTSKAAMEESATAVGQELDEFAARSAGYMDQQSRDYHLALEQSDALMQKLVRRQNFYASRLRQLAVEIDAATKLEAGDRQAQVFNQLASSLASSLDSMSHETRSLLQEAGEIHLNLDQNRTEAHPTDPATSLMNRTEMERYIANVLPDDQQANPNRPYTQLLFSIEFSADPKFHHDILRQAGLRLSSQWRHHDRVGRWAETEFLVVFQGDAATAAKRANQALERLQGRYSLKDGDSGSINADVKASFRLVGVAPAIAK